MNEEIVSRAFHDREIARKQNEIENLNQKLEYAVYRSNVSEWALTGVVTASAKIVITDSSRLSGERLSQAIDAYGKKAALELFRQAKLDFNAHADFYALRQHVRYMESHAGAQGVQFEKFSEREPQEIPEEWDRPEPFAAPFR